jgi:hypothetical protein
VPPDEGVVLLPPLPPLPPVPPPLEGGCAPPEGVVLGVCGAGAGVTLLPPLDGEPLLGTPPLLGVVVVGVVLGTVSGIAGAVSLPGTVSGGGGGTVSAL